MTPTPAPCWPKQSVYTAGSALHGTPCPSCTHSDVLHSVSGGCAGCEAVTLARRGQERYGFGPASPPLSKITRVEVIDDDEGGRVYSKWDVRVQTDIQDDGRTLKIFVRTRP